jgi:hypothetical protein
MRPPKPHTPGPWRASDREVTAVAAATQVATCVQPADARRIVAAVNACEAIPIRDLEAGILADLFFQCGRLKHPRIMAIMEKIRPAPDAKGPRRAK